MKKNKEIEKTKLLNLLRQLAIKSLENAEELLNESKLLYENDKFERAFFLTIIGVEEIGKHIICASGFVNSLKDQFDFKRFSKRFKNHLEKHYVINLFEELRFFDEENFKELKFKSDTFSLDKLKMNSLYTDYWMDYAFKPSEITYQQVANESIKLLVNRLDWFKNIGIIDFLKNDLTFIKNNINKVEQSDIVNQLDKILNELNITESEIPNN